MSGRRLVVLQNSSLSGLLLIEFSESAPSCAHKWNALGQLPSDYTIAWESAVAPSAEEPILAKLESFRKSTGKPFYNCPLEQVKSVVQAHSSTPSATESPADPFAPIDASAVPMIGVDPKDFLDLSGAAMCDLYIRLPSKNKFLPFVLSGVEYTQAKAQKLAQHVEPKAYARQSDTQLLNFNIDEVLAQPLPTTSPQLEQRIEDLRKALVNPRVVRADLVLESLCEYSQSILEDIPAFNAQNTLDTYFKDFNTQNNIKALTSIASLFAKAAGFNSKQVFNDLAQAVVLCDISLANISPHIMNRYFTGHLPDSDDLRQKFFDHPVTSEELVQKRFPAVSQSVRTLILLHHERFDGSGYPKCHRGGAIFPLAQVFGFAVDVFEDLKSRELRKVSFQISDVLLGLQHTLKESKSRRHSPQLIEKVMHYFNLLPKKKAA